MGHPHEQHEVEEPLLEHQKDKKRSGRHAWVHRGLVATVLLLGLSNVVLLCMVSKATPITQKQVSRYAGLSFNTPVVFQNWTEFTDPEVRDESWRQMDLTPLEVMFGDEELHDFHLEPTLARFPWDQSHGIYFVKAFHSLHCLKYLRYAIVKGDFNQHHVDHCLDTFRQDIMCFADDTPMPLHDLPDKLGNGQVRMCRDFEALIRWTRQKDRYPCYSRSSNSSSVIEAHGWCGPESPYYEAQQAYFERWGHQE